MIKYSGSGPAARASFALFVKEKGYTLRNQLELTATHYQEHFMAATFRRTEVNRRHRGHAAGISREIRDVRVPKMNLTPPNMLWLGSFAMVLEKTGLVCWVDGCSSANTASRRLLGYYPRRSWLSRPKMSSVSRQKYVHTTTYRSCLAMDRRSRSVEEVWSAGRGPTESN